MAEIDIPTVGDGPLLNSQKLPSALRSVPICSLRTRVLDGVLPDGQDNVVQNYTAENALNALAVIDTFDADIVGLIVSKVGRIIALSAAGYANQIRAEEGLPLK